MFINHSNVAAEKLLIVVVRKNEVTNPLTNPLNEVTNPLNCNLNNSYASFPFDVRHYLEGMESYYLQ